MRELHILCGIPASGKSVFARKESKRLKNAVIISRDVIRYKILDEQGGEYFDHENLVFATFVDSINSAIDSNVEHIFADATHINEPSRKKLLCNLKLKDEIKVVFDVLNPGFKVAKDRNDRRIGRTKVPDVAMKSMNTAFRVPTMNEMRRIKSQLNLKNEFEVRVH